MEFIHIRWKWFFLIFLITAIANAQIPEPSIRKFDNSYGLRTNNYHKVLQDSLGFIWVMYEYGIQRFDGRHTDNYFENNKSISLVQDSSGTVWVSNNTGIYRFNFDKQRFISVNTEENSEQTGLLFTFEGMTVQYISDLGIFRYNKSSDCFSKVKDPRYDIAKNISLQDANFCNKGKTIFYKTGDIINCHNLQSGKIDTLFLKDVWQISALSQYEIIATNWESKTWYFNFNTGKKLRLTYPDTNPFIIVFDAVKQKEKSFYLASSKGLLLFDIKTEKLQKVSLSFDGITLPNIRYRSLHKNKDGLTWAATDNNLICFTDSNEEIYFIRNNEADSDRQFSSAVRSFAEDESGNLWLATRNGITYWDFENNKFHTIKATENNNQRLNHTSIRGLVYDGNNLIIGQTNKGIWLYNPKQKTFKRPVFENNRQGKALRRTLEQDFISQIKTLRNGNHIVSARDGAYLINGNTYEITEIPFPGDELFVRFSYEDKDGNIFFGSKDGLYCLGANLEFKYEIKEQLENSNVFSLLEYGKGYYLGTQKGLYFFSYKNYNVTIEEIIPELKNEQIQIIFSDEREHLWFVTEAELHRLEWQTNTLSTFRYTENVLGNYFYHNSYHRNKAGFVFIGGINGINYFYPDKINIHPKKLNPYIRQIDIPGISQPIPADTFLKLAHNENNITLSFASPYYRNPSVIQYRYRLKDKEKWYNLGNTNTINLSNLSSDDYSIQIAASINGAKWHPSTDVFNFTIARPFWQTWWFIAGILLSAFFFAYKLFALTQRKLRLEKMLNVFATSLYGQNTVDNILWDTARNCVQNLGFVDAVVYLIDHKSEILVQKAAFGIKKNPYGKKIINIMEIPIGEGIVGSVAKSGKPECIPNTEKDSRYIQDSDKALSEITVPIYIDGKVFAIIDSEHPEKNFYKPYHLELLKKIAAICSERISKYLTEEQLRGKIARDLHDEMGSTLTSIQIISKMASQDAKKSPMVQKQFNQINKYTAGIMEKMGDLVWVINPANDSLNQLMYRIKEYAVDVMEPAGIQMDFHELQDAELIKINPERRKNIYLIAKETLNNAVKHSEATRIFIAFEECNDILKICINDNGKGFDLNTIKSGNGLKNITTRAGEINGNLQIETGKGDGVIVCLSLDITKDIPD